MHAVWCMYAVASFIGASFLYRHFFDPLRQFPGPYIASWTEFWRLCDFFFNPHRANSYTWLHRRYGSIVRIGPNTLSFSDVGAVKEIYGTDKTYQKAPMYFVAAATAKGHPTPSLFSSLDSAWHDNLKRAVNPSFSLSTLMQYEPFVDGAVQTFMDQMQGLYADKKGEDGLVDLPRWLNFYAFDVIGVLTYGKQFGFMERAEDLDGMIEKIHKNSVYTSRLMQMPVLDKLLVKNPVLLWFQRQGLFNARPNPAVLWALKRQQARELGEDRPHDGGRRDLIDKFLEAKEKNPESITDGEVLGMGLSMVFAGYETTAVTLTAIFYHILRNKEVHCKLRQELDKIEHKHDDKPIPFELARRLPYLDACIKEAFRIHPAARWSPERVLPAEGATISGHRIPGSTIVGINAWSLHHTAEIFGSDLDRYVPERWIAHSEYDRRRILEMDRVLFGFGSGKYMCIGKNISHLEMYKLVPTFLRMFEISCAHPDKTWRLYAGSFVNATEFEVRIHSRS